MVLAKYFPRVRHSPHASQRFDSYFGPNNGVQASKLLVARMCEL